MNILLTINRESQIYIEGATNVVQLMHHSISLFFINKMSYEVAKNLLLKVPGIIVKDGTVSNIRHYELFVKSISYTPSILMKITPKPKDSWNREEVEKLCREAYQTGLDMCATKHFTPASSYKDAINKFIKELVK